MADPSQDFGDILAESRGTAQQKAKSALREQNKMEWVCKLKTIGNVRMVAGATFMVEGFGVFDGKYIATSVKHVLSGGYTCEIEGRRVLVGY